MKKRSLRPIVIIFTCFFIGVLVLLIQRKWLIVYWNFGSIDENIQQSQKNDTSIRNKVRIYFWKNEKYGHEDIIIIWNKDNKTENLKLLISSWLSLLLDEKIISKKIELEHITVVPQNYEVNISFSQTFSWKDWSIFQKYKLVSSLLKTIKEADRQIMFVNLLVNGKPIEDTHLSFIQPWPADGFE